MDEDQAKRIAEHYDSQTEEEAIAEDETYIHIDAIPSDVDPNDMDAVAASQMRELDHAIAMTSLEEAYKRMVKAGEKDVEIAEDLREAGYTHGMRAEYALDGVAVDVLCNPHGCGGNPDDPKDFECPFEPMCAADLIPESQRRLIRERFEAMQKIVDAAREMQATGFRSSSDLRDAYAGACVPNDQYDAVKAAIGELDIREQLFRRTRQQEESQSVEDSPEEPAP